MIQGVAVGISKIQEGPNGIKDYKNSAGDDLKEGLKIQAVGVEPWMKLHICSM